MQQALISWRIGKLPLAAMGLPGVMDQKRFKRAIKNAKRLHGSPSQFPGDEQSPLVLLGIPYHNDEKE